MAIKIKSKIRIIYGILFVAILITEICIALFVKDNFIRPYVGDMLVTVLICCLARVFVPYKIRFMPFYVFLFACVVEIAQFFDFVKILGLDDNKFFSVLLGRTFSFTDIICYAIGCSVFAVLDYMIKKKNRGAI